MITITCKCGQTTMTFQNMSLKDFPKGWETDCCLVKVPVAVEEPKKVVVESIPVETQEVVEQPVETVSEEPKQPPKNDKKKKR